MGLCRIWDYVTFGIMSFGIMSHSGLCYTGLCHIVDYVAFGVTVCCTGFVTLDYVAFGIVHCSGLCRCVNGTWHTVVPDNVVRLNVGALYQ